MTVAGQKFISRHAACPLSRLSGEGWGEGGSMGCTNLILPQAAKPPHPNFPPPDGGRNKVADTVKGRLKLAGGQESMPRRAACPSPVWRERVGERVALWAARI